MNVSFTAHNIRLDDGTLTKPDYPMEMATYPWVISAKRILNTIFPGDKRHLRLADLGCLEGGYAVEFARLGFQVLGIEVRDQNIAACRHIKQHTNLPNLEFVQDDVWNLEQYGQFDVIFCCGLLYHLEQPRKFLQLVSSATSRLLILQTHFSTDQSNSIYPLSGLTENEALPGRWYSEFRTEADYQLREDSRWASWDNRQSFWIKREYLLQTIQEVGFDLVVEQFDSLGKEMARSIQDGFYKQHERGTFIGLKTEFNCGPTLEDSVSRPVTLENSANNSSNSDQPLPSIEEEIVAHALDLRDWLDAIDTKSDRSTSVISHMHTTDLVKPQLTPAKWFNRIRYKVQGVSMLEILQIDQGHFDDKIFIGAHVDLPKVGEYIGSTLLQVSGWVMARTVQPKIVRILYEGQSIAEAAINSARPDVSAAYCNTSNYHLWGYSAMADSKSLVGTGYLQIKAIFPDGSETFLSSIKFCKN